MIKKQFNKKLLKSLNLSKNNQSFFKSFLFERGLDNFSIISDYENRLWPHWIHKSLDPCLSKVTNDNNFISLINTKFRNWTYLKEKNCNSCVTIDPQGLINIENYPFSIDFWIVENNEFHYFAKNENITQKYHPNINSIETIHKFDKLSINNSTFFRTFPNKQNIIFNDSKIKNESNSEVSFSFFISIRPYDIEGITNLKKIQYLQSNAFIVNDKLSLCLNKQPDNILCLPFSQGDVSQFHDKLQMIFQVNCKEKKASALAEYKYVLKPGESTILSFKCPFTKNKVKKHFINFIPNSKKINKKIEELQKLSSAQAILDSSITKTTTKFNVPNMKVNNFIKSVYSQLSSSFNNKEINTGIYFKYLSNPLDSLTYVIFLFKFGYEKTKLEQSINKSYFRNILERIKKDESSIEFLGNWFEQLFYLQNTNILSITKEKIKLLQKIINQCLSKLENFNTVNSKIIRKRYCERKNKKTYNLIDNLSLLQSLRIYKKILIEDTLNKKDFINEIEKINQVELIVSNGIKEFTKETSKKVLLKEIICPEFSQTTTLNTIKCTHYYSKLYPSEKDIIDKTLDEIKKHFVQNNLIFSSINPTGHPIDSNLTYSEILFHLNDSNYFNLLNSLLNFTSSTFTLPNVIHHTTNHGSEGDGHNILLTVKLALFILESFIIEHPSELELFKHSPNEWLLDNPINISEFHTSLGILTIDIAKKNNCVELNYTIKNNLNCKYLIINTPKEFKMFSIGDNTVLIENSKIKVPTSTNKIIFYLNNENK